MAGVQACHEGASGGGADGVAGVVLGELHALGGEFIDVGGFYLFLAVTADFCIAEIVCEDVDYVWFAGGGGFRCCLQATGKCHCCCACGEVFHEIASIHCQLLIKRCLIW